MFKILTTFPAVLYMNITLAYPTNYKRIKKDYIA